MVSVSARTTGEIPPALIDVVARQCSGAMPDACRFITAALRESYGAALLGILFYGSCSRGEALEDGIADIYAVVDDYGHAYERRILARANAWLPPNVFYREISSDNGPVRVKLAVISLADFEKGILGWFHSYLWGRFAQPVRLLYSSDQSVQREFYSLLGQAVLTLLETTIPTLPEKFNTAEAIWTKALSLSYSAELRPESGARASRLVRSDLTAYTRLLDMALPALGDILIRHGDDSFQRLCNDSAGKRASRQWRWRCRQGRVLSVLRLMKAALTFDNGVDYAAWKINRHTGVSIEVTPGLRRRPLLFGWRVLRQLVKRGAIR